MFYKVSYAKNEIGIKKTDPIIYEQ